MKYVFLARLDGLGWFNDNNNTASAVNLLLQRFTNFSVLDWQKPQPCWPFSFSQLPTKAMPTPREMLCFVTHHQDLTRTPVLQQRNPLQHPRTCYRNNTGATQDDMIHEDGIIYVACYMRLAGNWVSYQLWFNRRSTDRGIQNCRYRRERCFPV